jgi:hypothetical protein
MGRRGARAHSVRFSARGPRQYTRSVRPTLALIFSSAVCVLAQPLAAQTQPSSASACADPACTAPALAAAPRYPLQIERGSGFSAEVTIEQPCRCERPLSVLVAFTPKGASKSIEHTFKLTVSQGSGIHKLELSSAELAREKIKPGRHTLTFTLFDERGKPSAAGALKLSGLPFKYGSSGESLRAQPKLPAAIGRDAELAVPFLFDNKGDIASDVTALLVFTRPDQAQGIEYYKPDLIVRPGGGTQSVRLTAAQRRTLKIGAGSWLVTASAFDGDGRRLASYPGHLLTIGKVLKHAAPTAFNSPLEQGGSLTFNLSVQNDSDATELITALLKFTQPGVKAIEHKVEGLQAMTGSSAHTISLSAEDRYNLGIRPGRWKVSISALDRANKPIEGRGGGGELVIKPGLNETAAR